MLAFISLPLVAVGIILIIHASANLENMKLHWNEYRCNPIYMPFAEWIRPDVSNTENLLYCTNNAGGQLLAPVLDVINGLFKTVTSSLGEFTEPMKIFRKMFSKMRLFILSFTVSTLTKASNSSSVFIHYIIKIRDILKRFVGQGYIASFIAYVGVSFIESFITLCISVIKSFVYAMLAISIVLAFFQPELLAIVLVLASLLSAAGA